MEYNIENEERIFIHSSVKIWHMKYQFLLKSYFILRKNISLDNGKPENSFNIAKVKTKNLNWLRNMMSL